MILIWVLRFLRSLGLVVCLLVPLLVFGLVGHIFVIGLELMILSLIGLVRFILGYCNGVSC